MIRLNEGWSLTDGVVQPVELTEPRDVVSALSAAGLLSEPEKGLNSLACEWVSARRWTYGLTFACPEGDRQRAFYFENLCGEGCVRLNGKKLADFCDQDVWADCTDALLPGENRLEAVFEARLRTMPGWDALPEIGLCGGVFLHESEDVRMEALEAVPEQGSLHVRCRLFRRRGAECVVRLRVRCEGRTLCEKELPTRLKERSEISCELPLSGAPVWDARRPEEGVLQLEAEVWRGEVLCDRAELETVRCAQSPLRVVQVDAYRPDAQQALLMERLGAQACVLLREKAGRLTGQLRGGLPRAIYEPGAPGSAMQREELLSRLAGEEPCWPPEEATLWRLRAKVSDEPDEALCAAFSQEVVCRYQRAMQAEGLRALAEERRLKGKALQVRLNDQDWKLASRALVDADGEERSAYWALSQAWAAVHVTLTAGQPGRFEVHLLSDGTQCDLMQVRAAVYDAGGALRCEREFVGLSDHSFCLGEVQAEFPADDGLLLLRTELRDSRGALLERCDRLAFAQADPEARLRRLTRDASTLEAAEEGLKNVSQAACLCLRAGEEYGFLLPGEVRTQARLEQAEWLNRED